MADFTFSTNPEDAILKAHDMSMGSDAEMACVGRASKHITHMIETWIGDELQRGTNPATILLTAQSSAVSLVISAIMNTVPAVKWTATAAVLRTAMLAEFESSIAAIGDIAKQEGA